MSTKKRGAPKKEVTASVRLNGRLTLEEKELLVFLSKKLNLNQTETIIKALKLLNEVSDQN